MIIHGREITLRRTVGAEVEIADMCQDGDIKNLADFLFKQTVYSRRIRNMAKFSAALSRAGESYLHFQNAEYAPDPLTVDEILSLSPEEFNLLQEAAMKAFMDDGKTTVETEAPKKRKATAE